MKGSRIGDLWSYHLPNLPINMLVKSQFCWEKPMVLLGPNHGFDHRSADTPIDLGPLGAAVVSAAFGEAHTHICTFLPLVVQPIDDGSLDDP